MHRTKRKIGATGKLAVYVTAGTLSAAAVGAGLGVVGGALGPSTRAEVAAALAVVGLVFAALGLGGRPLRPLQFDRETPYAWLAPGPVSWSIRNGSAIGIGAFTRLGYWLWYAVPLGALLSASPLLGGIGYGAYALARTGGAGIQMELERRGLASELDILRLGGRARLIADFQLLLLCLVTIGAVGL